MTARRPRAGSGVRRFFEDERGRIVLWQRPNPPLVTWAVATLGARILSGRPHQLAALVAFGALFTWSWLELFQGVTLFRRFLGMVVLVVAVASRIPD